MHVRSISRRSFIPLLGVAIGGVTADAVVSLNNRVQPRGIVIHHSAFPPSESLSEIERLHASRGFSAFYLWRTYKIGYHYLIASDGVIYPMRPEHLRGAHAFGANDMIGVCVLGNFDSATGSDVPTKAQMQSVESLCRRIVKDYGFRADNIHRHSDLNSYTVCPGDRFPFNELLTAI